MLNQFSRTELMFGKTAMERLYNSRIAVFGIGGVGSFTAEALIRSGIGFIDLFDSDIVSITNINRQLFATLKTIGKYKVDVAEERLLEINDNAKIFKHKIFFTKDNSDLVDFKRFDYIVDAIDTVSSKIELVLKANEYNIPIISSMGAGNKMNATKFEVVDIYNTSVCPLAKIMRYELRRRGIKKLKVVYSKEVPISMHYNSDSICKNENDISFSIKDKMLKNKRIPSSNSFVPPVVGLILAGEVIKDLIKKEV